MEFPSFIFTFCLLFLFCTSFVNSSPRPDNLKNSKNSENLKKVISGLVKEQLGVDQANTPSVLGSVYPESLDDVFIREHLLESCFVPSIKGGTQVKLFEEPIETLVYNYIQAYFPDLQNQKQDAKWTLDLKKNVGNLVNNIKVVSGHVIDCLKGLDDPDYEPTKLALNRFSSKSPEELRLNRRPLPPPMSKAEQKQKFQEYQILKKQKIGSAYDNQAKGRNNVNGQYDEFFVDNLDDEKVPATFDYRDQGMVSVVKDQGGGNTCFIFAAIAAIESSYLLAKRQEDRLSGNRTTLKSKKVPNLKGSTNTFSVQDTYNCLPAADISNHPDNGGRVIDVLRLFSETTIPHFTGIIFTQDEPEHYHFIQGNFSEPPYLHPENCHGLDGNNSDIERAQVIGWAMETDLGKNKNENSLMKLKKVLMEYGPVTARFRASSDPRWNNLAGEMNFPCVKEGVKDIPPQDHGMLVVGWTEKHVILKNSWGNYENAHDRWGKEGYLYLNNKYLENCGIFGKDSEIIFPAVSIN